MTSDWLDMASGSAMTAEETARTTTKTAKEQMRPRSEGSIAEKTAKTGQLLLLYNTSLSDILFVCSLFLKKFVEKRRWDFAC